MTLRLPDDDAAFYLAVTNRLPPHERPIFHERVAELLQRDPGPGTVNRAVRIVLHELRVAPAHRPWQQPRWSR